jgi:large subunit ribosomal protein L17
MSALVCSHIARKRIRTTVSKAREARRLAEKMVTLARTGTLAARRRAIAQLGKRSEVAELFENIAPRFDGRAGGYTRIVRLGPRASDGSEMVCLEWVDIDVPDRKRKTDKSDANT